MQFYTDIKDFERHLHFSIPKEKLMLPVAILITVFFFGGIFFLASRASATTSGNLQPSPSPQLNSFTQNQENGAGVPADEVQSGPVEPPATSSASPTSADPTIDTSPTATPTTTLSSNPTATATPNPTAAPTPTFTPTPTPTIAPTSIPTPTATPTIPTPTSDSL